MSAAPLQTVREHAAAARKTLELAASEPDPTRRSAILEQGFSSLLGVLEMQVHEISEALQRTLWILERMEAAARDLKPGDPPALRALARSWGAHLAEQHQPRAVAAAGAWSPLS